MRQFGKLSGIDPHTQVFNASDHRVSHTDVIAGKKPEERLTGEAGQRSIRADKLQSNQVKSLAEQNRELRAQLAALQAERAGLTTLNIDGAKPSEADSPGDQVNQNQTGNQVKPQPAPPKNRVTGGRS